MQAYPLAGSHNDHQSHFQSFTFRAYSSCRSDGLTSCMWSIVMSLHGCFLSQKTAVVSHKITILQLLTQQGARLTHLLAGLSWDCLHVSNLTLKGSFKQRVRSC